MLRQLPRSTAFMATARCHTFHLMAALNFASTTTTTPELSLPSAASKSRIIQIKPILLNNVAQTKRQSFPTFRSTASSGRSYRATLPRAAAVDAVTIEERTIAVGDKLPDAELSYFDKSGNIQTIKVSNLTKGKKVIVFAVPGAFTPTCTQKHVPSFLEKAEELKAKGVDTIACVSVNDVFVMKAWGESLEVNDKILLLSDGAAEFTKALGVTLDLTGKPQGLGVRSRRYALLAEDGVVKILNLEDGGSFTVSSAQEILKAL